MILKPFRIYRNVILLFHLIVLGVMAGRLDAADDDRYDAYIAATDPLTPEQEREKLHLPPGFEIEQIGRASWREECRSRVAP